MGSYSQIVKQAIIWEDYAYEFYLKAASRVGPMPLRYLFEKLAREELQHRILLEELDFDELPESSCGFNWFNILDGFKSSNSENLVRAMSILKFAIDKEKQAKDRYQKMAENTQDKKIKKLCTTLSNAESCHYSLLRAEYERLQKKGA